MNKVLFIFGTRPEAIKLAPVVIDFRDHSALIPRICVTAQHRHLLDQVLEVFHLVPDHDLNVMSPGQSLPQTTSRIIAALDPVLAGENPAMVVVQGDTTTTFCGALAAFYRRIPVAHVEAGLRTGDPSQPFPEEVNRLLTTRLASLHFAPTGQAAQNLLDERVPPSSIHVTGNTGIDAVLYTARHLEAGTLGAPPLPFLDPNRKLILVTAHRRESFGPAFDDICQGLLAVANLPNVQLVFPVHPNPNVQAPVQRLLASHPHIHLIDPLPYLSFVDLMRRAHILLTDSGGMQEEGPALGKPVLVLRDKTERPEGVIAGALKLVGTNPKHILDAVTSLLQDRTLYDRMSAVKTVFGDGHSATRIRTLIESFLAKPSTHS